MIAPNTNPSQSSPNPFIAWHRLSNGTINATDTELDEASSSCERWEWRCAGLVVLAVFVEVIIAWAHPSYDSPWNEWGTTLADVTIALGIVGEVIFGRLDAGVQTELRKRSNERLEAAIQSAAEANLETERLKRDLAARRLSFEQHGALVPPLKNLTPSIVLSWAQGDPEARLFAEDISRALTDAGIAVNTQSVFSTDVMIGLKVHPQQGDPATAKRLITAFQWAGLEIRAASPAPFLTIEVGSKPPPF